MNDITATKAKNSVKVLSNYVTESLKIINSVDWTSSTNRYLETKEVKNRIQIQEALSFGGVLIDISYDNCEAIIRTLSNKSLTVSPWINFRALIESTAKAHWLLNPTISDLERIKRIFQIRYDGLNEQRKVANVTKNNELRKRLDQRIVEVSQKGQIFGLQPILEDSKIIGIGAKMPCVNDIIIKETKNEILYRIASALVHAQPWAITQISYKVNRTKVDISLEKNISPESMFILAFESMEALQLPLRTRFTTLGKDALILERLHKNIKSNY